IATRCAMSTKSARKSARPGIIQHEDRETRGRTDEATIVNNLFARSVFFVKDAERSLRFYTETLGFSLEWKHEVQGQAFVFEVSLLGFQLILNQAESPTENRAGHGRVFIGLDDDQVDGFRGHIREK